MSSRRADFCVVTAHRMSAMFRTAIIAAGLAVVTSFQAAGDPWTRVEAIYRQRVEETGIVGSSLLFVRGGAVAHWATVGYQDAATRRAVDREHDLPLGVDHEDVHRRRDHAASRSRAALARRSGHQVRARTSRRPQSVRRHGAGRRSATDDPQRGLPRRDVAVGRRQGLASIRADALGSGGRDVPLHGAAVQTRHRIPLFESGRHRPRPHHRSAFPATTTKCMLRRICSCRSG